MKQGRTHAKKNNESFDKQVLLCTIQGTVERPIKDCLDKGSGEDVDSGFQVQLEEDEATA